MALAIGVEHVKLAGDAVWLAAAEGSARTCFQVPTGSVLFWRRETGIEPMVGQRDLREVLNAGLG